VVKKQAQPPTVEVTYFLTILAVWAELPSTTKTPGRAVVREFGAKLDETRGVHAALEDIKVNLPAGADHRDHVD
jgi:hypothetical protein